jgi:type I restriction enzyme S subunit
LDKADALRQKRRQAINKLDKLLQAVFLDMFGDPATNPKGWAKKSVGDSVELINGRAFKPSEWSKKGLPIVRIQNLKNPDDSFYNYFEGTCEEKYVVKAGDLLLSWAGQLVSFGVVVWTGPTGWLNQHIFRVVPKASFEISYLEFAFEHVIEQAKSKFHGIEMKHITRRDLVEYELPYPPIEIQKKFALRAEQIKSIRENQNHALIHLNNLFHSLQQRAFNGELFNGKATAAVLPQKAMITSQPELFD